MKKIKLVLLQRLFFTQLLGSMLASSIVVGAVLFYVREINFTAVENGKHVAKQAILNVQEKWRAWYLVGLLQALNDESTQLKKNYNLSSIELKELPSRNLPTECFQIPEINEKQDSNKTNPIIVACYDLSASKLSSQSSNKFVILLGFSFLFFILISLYSIIFTRRYIYSPMRELISRLENQKDFSKQSFALVNSATYEMKFFIDELKSLYERIAKAKNEEERLAVAKQVVHDIRSPLAALEMISGSLNELSEDKRLIIRNSINRIRDIANSLVINKQPLQSVNIQINTSVPAQQAELLMPILDSIVTEKRLQFRDQLATQIEFNQTVESYGLFSKINIIEFKRVLSNIINNSIEAFQGDRGMVFVELTSVGQENIIRIRDNGKGIPEHLLDQLGVRGATFDKVGGSGLGLYHAKTTVESWGGRLQISSKVGQGTVIQIYIPKQDTPNWFVPKLQFDKNTTVVVFDDDQTIHQIWTDKLVSAGLQDSNLLHLSTPNELRDYCIRLNLDFNGVLFLMDYEILNHRETGLDLIEELKIQSRSILVTSRYEEVAVRERCQNLGVRFIPKSMSGFVPVQIRN